jgi:hypothetical protein
MLVKALLSSVGCVLAWLFLLPALAFVGGAALFLYAIVAEVSAQVMGNKLKPLDPSTAREIARRICTGRSVAGAR